MKLCRYWHPDLGASLGIIENGQVYDLAAVDPQTFGSFSGLIGSARMREQIESGARRALAGQGLPFQELDVAPQPQNAHLLPPVTRQEVWAAGVTYYRSREARMEESADGSSFYDKVYYAERPELFFKATPNRVVGPNGKIRIRSDSRWNVPEPELALIISPQGALVAFTIGNDVSSREIEAENPLYLPQAKVYADSCALGPAFILADSLPDLKQVSIRLSIKRGDRVAFEDSTSVAQMKRTLPDLISYLYREQEFPYGAILLTGTGIVPPDDFTLQSGDLVEITIPEIGTLRNLVA